MARIGFEFNDFTDEFYKKLARNKTRALVALGTVGVELTTSYLANRYGAPIYITGDLMRSIGYDIDAQQVEVYIGSDINYAVFVHEGTVFMTKRAFIMDAIVENPQILAEVARERLMEGI